MLIQRWANSYRRDSHGDGREIGRKLKNGIFHFSFFISHLVIV